MALFAAPDLIDSQIEQNHVSIACTELAFIAQVVLETADRKNNDPYWADFIILSCMVY